MEQGSVRWPLVKYFSMAGFYTWIICFMILCLILKKKYCGIIVFIPAIITILVCIASPCTSVFRYYQSNVASMPILIGWVVYLIANDEVNTDK